jgi:hypothetical protein
MLDEYSIQIDAEIKRDDLMELMHSRVDNLHKLKIQYTLTRKSIGLKAPMPLLICF